MKFLHPEFQVEPASSLTVDLPKVKKEKGKYIKEKGISKKKPQLQNITPEERKHLVAITQKLIDGGQKPDKTTLDYALAKMRSQVKKPLPARAVEWGKKQIKETKKLSDIAVKGAMETYGALGSGILKQPEMYAKGFKKVTGLEHPIVSGKDIEELRKTTMGFWQPTETEVQTMDEATFMGKAFTGLMQAIGSMPIYVVAGAAGGPALKGILGKLAAKLGMPAATKAISVIQQMIGMGTGFGGLAVARGVGEEKPIGEILYDVGMAYKTAPAYVLGSSLGGAIGNKLTRHMVSVVGRDFARYAGQGIGGATGFGGATALSGGSAEEVAQSATIGAVLPLFVSNPLFKRTKHAFHKAQKSKFQPKEVAKTKEVFSKEINAYKGTQVDKVLQEMPPEYRTKMLNALQTDQMTGVKNRPAMVTLAAMPETKSVGMIDIDGMKGINTKHTHVGGDMAKRAVAKIGNAVAKKYGKHFGIVGGEEFILTNPTKAIMEEIRVAVANTKLTYKGKPIKLTVSGGIAEVGKGHDVFAGASANMLKAKKAGRNRIMGDIPVFQEAEPFNKTFKFDAVAAKLKVPMEQQKAIMDALRYTTPERAVPLLKSLGIKVDIKTLKALDPFAKGGAGVEKEFQHSVTDAFEQTSGNMDAMIQDLSKTVNQPQATLKKNITKKCQQWRISNAREANAEVKAILDHFGVTGMEKYIKKIKPEGKGAESFVMTHKETAELIKRADFKAIEKTFGKNGYTLLVTGQKKYVDAMTYAEAFRGVTAKYFASKNPVEKAKLAQTATALGNLAQEAHITYRLLQADAGRFIEYAKVGKKGEGYKILNNMNNFLKSGGMEHFKVENIERVMRQVVGAKNPTQAIKKMNPGVSDMFLEWYRTALLSGPPTTIVNITSNVTHFFTKQYIEKGIAAVTDIVKAPFKAIPKTKPAEKAKYKRDLSYVERFKERRQDYFSELKTGTQGAIKGFVSGAGNALKALIHDKPGVKGTERAYETARHRQAIPGPLGYGVRQMFRNLSAMDAWGYSVNYNSALGQELYFHFKKKGFSGKSLKHRVNEGFKKPPKEVHEIADAKALEMLYQEKLGSLAKQGQKVIQEHALTQMVVPFYRTPTNVAKWGWRHTPGIGLAGQNWAKLKQGGRAQNEAIARQVVGAAVFAGVTAAYEAGLLTGSAPRKPDERARFYASGKMPYAVKMGDRYVGIPRLEPFTTLYKISVGSLQAWDDYKKDKEADEGSVGTLLTDALSKTSEALLDQTFVLGLGKLFDAIQDPERYGHGFVKGLILASTVPSGVGYLSRTTDPTLYEGKGIIESAKARIPGMHGDLEPRLSPLGEEQKREPLTGRLVGIVKPGVKLSEVSPVWRELDRLDITISYPMASRKITDPETKKKHDIPIEDYNKMLRYVGGEKKAELQKTIASPAYQQADDEERVDIINSTLELIEKRYLKRYIDNFKESLLNKLKQEVKK